jgi:aryl-alcohol dehydrogenase-like predicted oxidoreductase
MKRWIFEAHFYCVQNQYNLAHRDDDALVDALAGRGIAYVPFFPLGGFSPLQSWLGATPMQVGLAWLLHRAPNILLIPGTSSSDHLRENLAVLGPSTTTFIESGNGTVGWTYLGDAPAFLSIPIGGTPQDVTARCYFPTPRGAH